MNPIIFTTHDVDFDLHPLEAFKPWIAKASHSEGFDIEELHYIFTSDPFLLNMNQKYLGHDTFTDIITFDYSNYPKMINGEIFISIDRVRENAKKFRVEFTNELSRVVIHGVLHLMGYTDKTLKEKKHMREKEDAYISLLKI